MITADLMTIADTWLLPDGVTEILPSLAKRIEVLRRELLDLYDSWGYDLVIPPLIEYQESLLIGLGNDMDRQTFKVTDQISGRTLAIRADITPQTARIDSHSLKRQGPNRLCYADSVLKTKPKTAFASRSAIEVGAELYGEASLGGDLEVISLMLATLKQATAKDLHLDLGHVGIFRNLAAAAKLNAEQEQQIFDALQRKATTELEVLVKACVSDAAVQSWLLALPHLHGDESCLIAAKQQLQGAPQEVQSAIDDLAMIAVEMRKREPKVNCYFDLAELRGYNYHTGLVFAAFVEGVGRAVANGGRYDNIGEVFGRARPATGFSTDLQTLVDLEPVTEAGKGAIFAPLSAQLQQDFWTQVETLRKQGERVIIGLNSDLAAPESCQRVLKWADSQWQLALLPNCEN